jgi:hypothetical protein
MSKGRFLASATAMALVMSIAGPASAAVPPGTLDANHACSGSDCNVPDASYPSVNAPVGPGSTDAASLGQTFTPATSGHLTGVSLDVGVYSGDTVVVPASLTVEIVTTDGGGVPQIANVLASENVATGTADWPAAGDHGWLDVTFSSPPAVTAGHVYAIVLGPSALPANPWMLWEIDSTSAGAYSDYAGGEAYGGSLYHGTGSWVWNTMYSWLADGGTGTADFAFRTYVEAPAATASPGATFVPTQPPTDIVSVARTETATQGWLGLLIAVVGFAAVAFAVASVRPARRRR